MKKLFLLGLMITISISIGTMLANNNSPPVPVNGGVIMPVNDVSTLEKANVMTMDNAMTINNSIVMSIQPIEATLCKNAPLPEFNTGLIVDFSVAICNNTMRNSYCMNGGTMMHRMLKAELTADFSSFVNKNNLSNANTLANGGVVRHILKCPMNCSFLTNNESSAVRV